MPRPQPYIAQLLGLTVLLLAAIATANYAVDPFGIFAVPTLAGRTEHKPGLHNRDRMVKAYAIARQAPDALLLGTSRVQFGMDPNDAVLRRVAARPYNAGLVNADVYMVLRYLQHAQAVAPLKIALVGIDPLMFDAASTTAVRDFTEQRLAAAADGRPQAPLTRGDLPLTLLSSTAVRLSFVTLRHQEDILTDLCDNGQRNPAVLEMYSRANGTLAANVRLIERDYAAELTAARFFSDDGHAPALAALRRVLDFARAQHIALHLFFTPGHVRMLELMRATHRLEEADRLKREVVALVAEEARAGGGAPAAVWDFSAPSGVTCEALPASTTADAMANYWETSHFRSDVGHRIIAQILEPRADADFGVALTPSSIDAAIATARGDLAAWEARHPEAVTQIAAYAADAARAREQEHAARVAHGGRP